MAPGIFVELFLFSQPPIHTDRELEVTGSNGRRDSPWRKTRLEEVGRKLASLAHGRKNVCGVGVFPPYSQQLKIESKELKSSLLYLNGSLSPGSVVAR